MSITTFQNILTSFRKLAFSERDKGDKFERLMQAYLKTDPKYAYTFRNVWLWNEFAARKDFGGQDTGIDLVDKINRVFSTTAPKYRSFIIRFDYL